MSNEASIKPCTMQLFRETRPYGLDLNYSGHTHTPTVENRQILYSRTPRDLDLAEILLEARSPNPKPASSIL